MIKEWFERAHLFATRLKIERPNLRISPRFKTTLFILWLLSLFGLGYGHVFSVNSHAKSASLFLTLLAWIGSIFIMLLDNPSARFKRHLLQLLSLFLLLSSLMIFTVTYSLFIYAPHAVLSLKIAWAVGTLLLLYLMMRAFYYAYISRKNMDEEPYPGLRTAPLLFFILLLNGVWWFWPNLITWIQSWL